MIACGAKAPVTPQRELFNLSRSSVSHTPSPLFCESRKLADRLRCEEGSNGDDIKTLHHIPGDSR
jgi:hypothetical protein